MFDLLRRKSALHAAVWAASAFLLASCGGGTEENPAPPPIQSTTWVMGASLSDNGNECIRTPASCPPAPPYATGIYSNGPLWVDTVAARVGGAAKPSLAGGTNYAFAGARTGPVPGVTGAAASTVPTMLAQFNTLLLAQGNRISPNALVIVDGSAFGNNVRDALGLIAANPANGATIANSVVTSGVTDVVSILNIIFNTGGRNVLVVNVPDVGKTPLVQSLNNAQIAAVATQMSAGYNGALLQQINSLRALPGYSIKVLDLFALLSEAQAAPASFGLTNATAPCFVPPPTGPLLCPSPNTYLFWDPFHPTYATGQIMATRALAAIGR
ncbi:MAG TPA: SGNH/GDSL hydrolase family protein [Burkholderiaceae bacterium]|nr:SGNH/GDSL hydrolase family protein [Burkholderiaceae bacterium]HQR77036.1 SGNH/GDSL hydrolase family protein [Burkholderiaceae bacterium]